MRVRVRIETPRGSFLKRGSDGAVDFVSPVPCPFDYGSVVGEAGGDGDPLDALVLGTRLAAGDVVEVPVRAVVRFLDAGAVDDKLVCSEAPPSALQRRAVLLFFEAYARIKRAANLARRRPGETRVLGWEPR
ncbi:MAG: inorganic diphosphatase [Myxococcota bacterium]